MRSDRSVLLGSVLSLVVCSALTDIGATAQRQIWSHDDVDAFTMGEKEHVSVSTEGVITLAFEQNSILADTCETVFDVLPVADTVYVATGNQGKLYRLEGGKTDVAADVQDPLVLSLAADGEGNVFAGTGPSGKVYRLDSKGECKLFAELPAAYVWALEVDGEGGLLAATGDEGKLFRISKKGEVKELFDGEPSHVLCLARDEEGNFYAGAGDRGIVYRISPAGAVTVVYDALEGEIRAIATGPGGVVYFGTADMGEPGEEGASQARAMLAQELLQKMTAAQMAQQEGAPVQQPPVVKRVTGKNVVYRLEPSGYVQSIAQFPEKVVLALAVGEDGVYVGTGFDGYVYRVDENLECVELTKLDEGQVTALAFDGKGRLVVGSANDGKVLRMLDGYMKEGAFTGTVLDAGNAARWGKAVWYADAPAGTSVTVTTRSGNSAQPDGTWSAWSAALLEPAGSQVESPTGRFLQYRLTLKTQDAAATPVFRGLEIPYLVGNLPPKVTSLTVTRGDDEEKGEKSKKRSAGPEEEKSARTVGGNAQVAWTAEDPNSDQLLYDLEFRGLGETNWKLLAEALEESSYTWDTRLVPDGMYEMRLTAGDAASNTADEAMQHEKVSRLFRVDNTPPVIEKLETKTTKGGTVHVRCMAADGAGRVLRAMYSVDASEWQEVAPKDGIADSAREEFEFEVDSLEAGEHTLAVAARDDVGNIGSAKCVLQVEGGPASSPQE
ncbi:MAG: hypothetical protein V2A58_17285 [Planctomycetota bacterium]